MPNKTATKENGAQAERPPVVVVMGHVDHGKSTLLDYIRQSNTVDGEAGGITQHLAAYEVEREAEDTSGEKRTRKITFLDTPGHAAFSAIRTRGAKTADIAILVVAADDGVKEQTLEAIKIIKEEEIPYIVAINKIDKDGADVIRTKTSLSENEIYVEGFGGSISAVEVSALEGTGIGDLLDTILLTAELEELKVDPSLPAEGVVIESNLDAKKGISATLIIKNGTLSSGQAVVSGKSFAPVRIMEDFTGKQIKEATVSSPIQIIGWDTMPVVGTTFTSFKNKKDALKHIESVEDTDVLDTNLAPDGTADKAVIPIIIKADTTGSLEAVLHEIKKLPTDRAFLKVLAAEVGPITEKDIKTAQTDEKTIIVGFNTSVETAARGAIERIGGITPATFTIIYELAEWLGKEFEERTPKVETEEIKGNAKILRVFSAKKDKQVVGGKVKEGKLVVNEKVNILRRDNQIGKGTIRQLQQQKQEVREVNEGNECGMMIESRVEIAEGDRIEAFEIVTK